MKKLILLTLIPLSVLADDISWSGDCSSTNCGNTISGTDTVTGVGSIFVSGAGDAAIKLDGSVNSSIDLTGNLYPSGNFGDSILLTNTSTGNTLNLTGSILPSSPARYGLRLITNSDSNTITINGDISVPTLGAGVQLETNSNVISITGDISNTTTGYGVVLTSADSNSFSLTGDITTTGTWLYGYSLYESNSNTITHIGDISTKANSAFYIYENSDSNTFYTTGNITTTGDSSYGYFLENSSSNTISHTGNITTSGNTANGLYVKAVSTNNSITLTGDITTSGTNSDGILLFRGVSPNTELNSNEITMTGNILTSGTYSSGYILEDAHDNTVTHTGNITTTNNYSEGFSIYTGDSNTATITGTITTSGSYGYGIYISDGDSNSITMNGDIDTSGRDGRGFHLTSSNSNTIVMTGNITTTNSTQADGIYLYDSDSNDITINGKITTASNSGIALVTNSDSNTITVSNGINSTKDKYAIYIDSTSDNNTINLTRANFIGKLYNDGSNNTLNFSNLGRAGSYIFTTQGSTAFSLTDSNKPVISGSAKSRGIADIDDEGNKLYQRFNPISRATSSQHKSMAMGDARHDFWIDGYYSDSDRTNSYKELNHKTRGLTVGFNVSGDRQLPLDLIVNFENSDTGYGQSDQSIDTNSVMAGLFYPKLMQAFNGSLALKFLTGVADNESDIKVLNNTASSGQETVTEDYTSYYVMVGGEWLQPLYQGENIHHDIFLGLDVMHEKINSHSSSSYFYMSDRDITQLNSSIHYGFSLNSDDKKLIIMAKAGIEQTDMLEGEYQYYKVDGTATRFKGDERNTYMTASLGADYKFTDNAKAYFNVQKFDSSDDIDGTSGNVGFVYNF